MGKASVALAEAQNAFSFQIVTDKSIKLLDTKRINLRRSIQLDLIFFIFYISKFFAAFFNIFKYVQNYFIILEPRMRALVIPLEFHILIYFIVFGEYFFS